MANRGWGSDTPISMPVPPVVKKQQPKVDFGGFGFSDSGMVYVFNEADREEITSSYYPASEQGFQP